MLDKLYTITQVWNAQYDTVLTEMTMDYTDKSFYITYEQVNAFSLSMLEKYLRWNRILKFWYKNSN